MNRLPVGSSAWGVFVPCRVFAMTHIMPRLRDDRPWLSPYPAAVPRPTDPYPSESVFGLLESAAGRFPDRPAIAWFGKHLSYRQLLREVERCSAGLAGVGLR